MLLSCWTISRSPGALPLAVSNLESFRFTQEIQAGVIRHTLMFSFPRVNQSLWLIMSLFEGYKVELENGMSCLQEINFLFHCT